MKTVAITSFHAHITRNILQAGVLELLLNTGTRVVLLVPPTKVEYFRKTFSDKEIFVEAVEIPKKTFEGAVMLFGFGLFNIQNRVVREWKEKKWFMYVFAVIINNTLAHIPILRTWLRTFASWYFASDVLDPLIEKYDFDLVVTTDSFYREDRAICISAKKRGIKTVGMIRSWDNATTKGVFMCNPDRVTVPNQVLKDELTSIHRVPANRVTVTGWPHYDSAKNEATVSKEAFYTSMGLDPSKKTILYGPGGVILYKHDREVLVMLKRLVDTNAFSVPVQFLVRFPPGDELDTSPIEGDPNFIIDKPGTNITGRKKESEMTVSDQEHLENSLHHVDLVLTLVSTLAIDGTVFGKPVVILGFDVPGTNKQSVSTFSVRLHFRKLLASGLVTVPKSEAEFVKNINAYLESPNLHNKERLELISRYAYALDGKSAQRVVDVILEEPA